MPSPVGARQERTESSGRHQSIGAPEGGDYLGRPDVGVKSVRTLSRPDGGRSSRSRDGHRPTPDTRTGEKTRIGAILGPVSALGNLRHQDYSRRVLKPPLGWSESSRM